MSAVGFLLSIGLLLFVGCAVAQTPAKCKRLPVPYTVNIHGLHKVGICVYAYLFWGVACQVLASAAVGQLQPPPTVSKVLKAWALCAFCIRADQLAGSYGLDLVHEPVQRALRQGRRACVVSTSGWMSKFWGRPSFIQKLRWTGLEHLHAWPCPGHLKPPWWSAFAKSLATAVGICKNTQLLLDGTQMAHLGLQAQH